MIFHPDGCFLVCLQDGLSGKTPLHYVIEKKNADFLKWFLELVKYFEMVQRSSIGRTGLLREVISAKTNASVTSLNLAATLQMDRTERVRIIELLLMNGAELTQRDSSLKKELSKIPEVRAITFQNCQILNRDECKCLPLACSLLF